RPEIRARRSTEPLLGVAPAVFSVLTPCFTVFVFLFPVSLSFGRIRIILRLSSKICSHLAQTLNHLAKRFSFGTVFLRPRHAVKFVLEHLPHRSSRRAALVIHFIVLHPMLPLPASSSVNW